MFVVRRSRAGGREATEDRAVEPVPHQELLITQLRQDNATGHQRLGAGERRHRHLAVSHPRHGLVPARFTAGHRYRITRAANDKSVVSGAYVKTV